MAQKKLKNISRSIQKHHREIIIGFCAMATILVRMIFPAKTSGEFFWISISLFLVFPWLVVVFLLKENIRSFGFSLCNFRMGIIFSSLFAVIFVLANFFITRDHFLRSHLQISPEIVKSFWVFLWFQAAISLPTHFSSEFFFRGFLQFGLERKIGKYAVLLQALAQTLLFVKSPWIVLFLVGSSSLVAGTIAMKSRSIFYSFFSMWIISASLDIMIIRLIYRGTI